MKQLTVLLLLVGLWSCSSTKKEVAPEKKDEFHWIDDNDFDRVSEEKFSAKEDSYQDEELLKNDSLGAESMHKSSDQPRIMNLNLEGDKVGALAANCYQGRYSQAMSLATKLYKKFKKNPSYWNQLGTCYVLQKEYRKAILYYNKSRDMNKMYAPAINNLGVIYQRQGYTQKALVAYKKAYEINSFSLTPAFNLAQLYLQYGFYEDARVMLMALHNKNKNDADVIHSLGTIYLAEGENSRAVQMYSTLGRDQLARPQIGINFSLALKSVGRNKDARTIFSSINKSLVKGRDLSSYYEKVSEEFKQ
jgi:Flp pilus assembly protein TadD